VQAKEITDRQKRAQQLERVTGHSTALQTLRTQFEGARQGVDQGELFGVSALTGLRDQTHGHGSRGTVLIVFTASSWLALDRIIDIVFTVPCHIRLCMSYQVIWWGITIS
jgi:hypothetical protein